MPTKILVVDDEPNIQPLVRQIFRQQIREGQYHLLFAPDGVEALEIMQRDAAIEVLLTDINMPNMDGLTLLTNLSVVKSKLSPVLTCVILSAYDDMANIRRAMNAGAFDFLTKPIDPQDLRITMKKTVQHVARLKHAIEQEKEAQRTLQRINEELEQRVKKRTADLESANKALLDSNAELDAFARTVAHDLKNPVGVIVSYTSLILSELDEAINPNLHEMVTEIQTVSYNTIDIIEELLILAGVRKANIKPVPLDMGQIVERAENRLASMIELHSGEIIRPQQWPTAQGYAPWVEEVWINYLSNGLKYSDYPPRLTCGATPQPDGMISFWVKDNGPGLDAEAQRTLFKEFSRLDTMRAKGHGLGLSIVCRIVQKLGGKVGVESKMGEGSLFYFTLKAVP